MVRSAEPWTLHRPGHPSTPVEALRDAGLIVMERRDRLMILPNHPDRMQRAAALLHEAGFSVERGAVR